MIKYLSIIIPFLNEEENIDELLKKLEEYSKAKPYRLEVIFVDDGSTDKTVEKIISASHKNIDVKVVKFSKNFGSHAALRAGIKNASAEYVMFFSADLQEPFEMIDLMIKKISEGNDYVCARKKDSGSGFVAGIFSDLYSSLIRKFAVKNFPFGGVNNILFNNKIKENLNNNIERNSSIFLQIINMGYKMAVIDVSYTDRKKGKSKWTFSKRMKLLVDSFVAFSFFPIRLVSFVGILFFLTGIFIAFGTIIIKIFNIVPLALGYPTLISFIAIGFGITNISLGIIAEYLWRSYDYSRDNPPFIIDEVIDLKKE